MKKTERRRSIIDMNCGEARAFLLKDESYCNTDLPPYFQFGELLQTVTKVLDGNSISEFWTSREQLRELEGVNYRITKNLDGKHKWRPLELIHPALYVSLVDNITSPDHWGCICDRFRFFGNNPKIQCLSIPVQSLTDETDIAEQISQWWTDVEQKSIELSMDYAYVIHTDIADCYPGIYTHTIAWALHTKPIAKERKRDGKLTGNIIDCHIVNMQQGQTNGIPQGSVLMDIVAEILLGYADSELAPKIEDQKIYDYQILRYRDDYRIFVNNTQDGDRILKSLTDVLTELGLQLNPAKTNLSNEVIQSSIKEEKLNWTYRNQFDEYLQRHLLIIHDHSRNFPDAGSLESALRDFHKRIYKVQKLSVSAIPLIAIVTDILYQSPRTYRISGAILSKLIDLLDSKCERRATVERILRRFSDIPNTGYMEIWLQRFSQKFAPEIDYDESLCKLVYDVKFPAIEYDESTRTIRHRTDVSIWNNDWISANALRNAVDPKMIVDLKVLDELSPVVTPEEVQTWSEYNR